MNVLQYFVDTMTVLAADNPALAQGLQQNLDSEDAASLQSLLAKHANGETI